MGWSHDAFAWIRSLVFWIQKKLHITSKDQKIYLNTIWLFSSSIFCLGCVYNWHLNPQPRQIITPTGLIQAAAHTCEGSVWCLVRFVVVPVRQILMWALHVFHKENLEAQGSRIATLTNQPFVLKSIWAIYRIYTRLLAGAVAGPQAEQIHFGCGNSSWFTLQRPRMPAGLVTISSVRFE